MLLAFLRRDWTTQRSYRFQFVFDIVGSLTTLAMFFFLGDLIAQPGGEFASAEAYLSFAVVGIATMQVVNTTVTSITSRLRTEQTTGTFEMLVASPTPRAALVVGTALFDALWAILWAAVLVVLAVLFFGVSLAPTVGSLLAAGVAIVASGALFLGVGAALAGFTVVFKAAGGIVSIYVTAVGVLCGVYYPTSVLPAPLRTLSDLIPLTWAVDVLRRALLDGEVEWGRLGLLVGAGVLAMPIGVLVFEAAVKRAMKAGTLAQY